VIGLVLVCHSARLAAGVVELAAQMGGPELRIAPAGGLDQPGDPLGTDATRVVRAIEEVWSADGVLVLMDLGSAVLSAEMALDLLPRARRDRVVLTAAPFVEGAVAAAVAAGLGGSLETVAAEARGGLAAKVAQLAPPAAQAPGPGGSPELGEGPALRLLVANPLGLHMRPAALLVRTAAAFDAEVTVANATVGSRPVSARSLNAVATLGVRHGQEIVVRARGPQAAAALAAVRRLADENFGDPPQADQGGAAGAVGPGAGASAADVGASAAGAAVGAAAGHASAARPAWVEGPAPAPAPGSVLRGLPAAPGIAIGAAQPLRPAPALAPDGPAADREADWAALERALAATADDLRRARDALAGRVSDGDAAIFDAHLLLLSDEALLGPARAQVLGEGRNAASAWDAAVRAAATAWEALDDPYLRARAADLRGVADQVLRHLLGLPAELAAGAAGIVVALDLTPAQTAGLDREQVWGVACAGGGPTSHSAILVRSLGIPAVMACGRDLLGVVAGTLVVLDGETGTVTVAPPPAVVAAARKRRAGRERAQDTARRQASLPAVTRDGLAVDVAANVAASGDLAAALAAGADGVGLLRTEFLFVAAGRLPDEDEQERAYRALAEGLDGRPLVVRTLDVGADKQLPFLPQAREDNPSLGLRGIRLGLRHVDLLVGQLRAVLRVSADHPVRLLLPMVSTVDEVRRTRELLDEARESLVAAGMVVPARLDVGIMVEVPATALLAETFVPCVDFFSLGTNDLAQYVLAADRGNAGVAALADALHPAVLRLIDHVVRAAAEGGRPVAVCGEAAADPLAIPLLLGLGVTGLSMAAARIPAAKQAVRRTDGAAARRLAAAALSAESAAAVRRLAGGSG
jgi:phosphocarrier protein FPr